MKKILTILFIVTTISLIAQVPFELKGGVTISNFNISHTSYNASTSVKAGLYAGILLNLHLFSKLRFLPGLEYAMEGAVITSNNILFASGKYTLGYLNIPLLVRYQTHAGFFAETGPKTGILTNAQLNQDNYGTSSGTNGFNSVDFAWTLGLGTFVNHNLGIDAHYTVGFTNIRTQKDAQFENRVIQAGLFYIFNSN